MNSTDTRPIMTRTKRYAVAMYLEDRAYGGPEEGGWWFNYGAPVEDKYRTFTRWFRSENAALEYAQFLNRTAAVEVNRDRRPICSVLSDGRYRAYVTKGAPRPFPDHQPHYE